MGDEAGLAKKLGVSVHTVADWLLGDKPLPADMFLLAVDIVLTNSRERVRISRSLLDEIKSRRGKQ
jgi:hypothetical protein